MVEFFKRISESNWFGTFMILIVLINTIIMGVQTIGSLKNSNVLEILDYVFLGFFVLEALIKILAYHLSYFLSAWNWFDLIIIVISLIPSSVNISSLRALRAFKAFRAFKVIEHSKILKEVFDTIVSSLPQVGIVGLLSFMFFYVYSLVGCYLYAQEMPEYFGTLFKTMMTMVQIMTMEGFTADISRPLTNLHWYNSLFFISYVLVLGYILSNLVVGVIVGVINQKQEADAAKETLEKKIEEYKISLTGVTLEENTNEFIARVDEMYHIIDVIENIYNYMDSNSFNSSQEYDILEEL